MTVCSGSEETLVLLRVFAHENVLRATLHYPRWASIRVEHSALMAQYVLGQRRQWNADTIQRALQPDPARRSDPYDSPGDFLCHRHCRQ